MGLNGTAKSTIMPCSLIPIIQGSGSGGWVGNPQLASRIELSKHVLALRALTNSFFSLQLSLVGLKPC